MQILITAGPTWEAIDAVRYIGNRSSGRTGLAIARAALEDKHQVTVLMGPCIDSSLWLDLKPNDACRILRFESTDDLKHLLGHEFPQHDVLFMAASVADYQPTSILEGKKRREPEGDLQTWTLKLQRTIDLVSELSHSPRQQRIVAFALEAAEQLDEHAVIKLERKGVDAIVANPLNTPGSQHITPTWITADNRQETPGPMTKDRFGRWLVDKIKEL